MREEVEALNVTIWERRLSDHVVAKVGQLVQTDDALQRARSQFLTLTIEDSRGGWVCIRLSTFRKLLRWIGGLKLLDARRMTETERRIVDRRRRL